MAVLSSLNSRHKAVFFLTALAVGFSLITTSNLRVSLGVASIGIAMAWAVGSDSRLAHLLLLVCGLIVAAGPVVWGWTKHQQQRRQYEKQIAQFEAKFPDFASIYPLWRLQIASEDTGSSASSAKDAGPKNVPFDPDTFMAQRRREKVFRDEKLEKILDDDDFWGLKMEDRIRILEKLDPDFAILPQSAKIEFADGYGFNRDGGLVSREHASAFKKRVGARPVPFDAENNPFALMTPTDRSTLKSFVESRIGRLSIAQQFALREALTLLREAEVHPMPMWFQASVAANVDPRLIPRAEIPGPEPTAFSLRANIKGDMPVVLIGAFFMMAGLVPLIFARFKV
jgi:hypothetical protein